MNDRNLGKNTFRLICQLTHQSKKFCFQTLGNVWKIWMLFFITVFRYWVINMFFKLLKYLFKLFFRKHSRILECFHEHLNNVHFRKHSSILLRWIFWTMVKYTFFQPSKNKTEMSIWIFYLWRLSKYFVSKWVLEELKVT